MRRTLLALVGLALTAALLAACGSDAPAGPSGPQLLTQTFGAKATPIRNAGLDVDFELKPEGLLRLGGPIKLALNGPFAAPRTGELPRFDVDLGATLNKKRYAAALRSTGTAVYADLEGTSYAIDDGSVLALRRGLRSIAGKRLPALTAIGIDPQRWIAKPKSREGEPIGGVATQRFSGDLDVARALADFDRLLTKAGGHASIGSLINPTLRRQIAGAVTESKVDVWTGAKDHIVRQIAMSATFAFPIGKTPVQGLQGGTFTLRIGLSKPNATPVTVSAPADPRPISVLTGGGIDRLLAGVDKALTGGAGIDLLGCLQNASGNSAELVKCVAEIPDLAG
jgi:hypothetical protein